MSEKWNPRYLTIQFELFIKVPLFNIKLFVKEIKLSVPPHNIYLDVYEFS